MPHGVGVDVIDLQLQLGFLAQRVVLEGVPDTRLAADYAVEQYLEQPPPRGARGVARGQGQNAMQMIGQDHACGERKRIAIAACPEHQP